jgi:hypothetical protein
VGACIGLVISLTSEFKYKGVVTFIVEDSKGGLFSAYSGIASQFGIDLGGGGSGNGAFDGDNIMGLLKSRRLLEETLLTGRAKYEGKLMTLADYYISFNEMKDNWKERPDLLTLNYPLQVDRRTFSRDQDSILNVIQDEIAKKLLTVEKTDKKLSFLSVIVNSTDETFSKVFAETLVKVAMDFYVDTKTQRNKTNVDRLQVQADSIEVALNQKTYSVARVQDINVNPAKQVATVGLEVAQRDKLVLQTMYGEVIKNLELSKLAMTQETPIIQIIDYPILPLEKKRFGKVKGVVLGGVAAGFLCMLWLFIRKLYRDIME